MGLVEKSCTSWEDETPIQVVVTKCVNGPVGFKEFWVVVVKVHGVIGARLIMMMMMMMMTMMMTMIMMMMMMKKRKRSGCIISCKWNSS